MKSSMMRSVVCRTVVVCAVVTVASLVSAPAVAGNGLSTSFMPHDGQFPGSLKIFPSDSQPQGGHTNCGVVEPVAD